MSFENTELWKSLSCEDSARKELTEHLRAEFQKTRANAAVLTGEIQTDLPDFTVHDIDHLDALWGVADQIIGDVTELNPLEVFVLGCSFLFHDAGMTLSAYPRGMEEVRGTREWKKLVSRTKHETFLNDDERDRALLGMFLREQHAKRAEELPFAEWKDAKGSRAIFSDPDLRQKFGQAVGKVSASHWWDHEQLENELNYKLPAPTGFPTDWPIDLLKVACVLRCTDAANIDSSRAPGFLWALRRGRISNYSNMHWSFQNRMTPPRLEGDALHYGSTYDFERKDAAEWWLAFDTITMVDKELRKSDALMARLSGGANRLAARRVSGIDSPASMTNQITVRGWTPVDTAFSISDIPSLVERLGGEQLYGKDVFVPVRELIVNGMDAVRVRRKVDPGFDGQGAVSIDLPSFEPGETLVIEDDGVGMSEQGLVSNLLSFGTSGWLNDPAIGEFNEEYLETDDVSGQFGIGFFSVFMLGQKVKVTTRRYDAGADDTFVLEFTNGLRERPILYRAEGKERRTSGGTRIEVVVEVDGLEERFTIDPRQFVNDSDFRMTPVQVLAHAFPVSDVILRTSVYGETAIIDGSNWRTEPALDLILRLHPTLQGKIDAEFADRHLQVVETNDGEIIGRLAYGPFENMRSEKLFLDPYGSTAAAVCYRGTRLGGLAGSVGIVLGRPTRAARDAADCIWSEQDFLRWERNQLLLLLREPDLARPAQESLALVASRHEDVDCHLPYLSVGGELLSRDNAIKAMESMDEIWLWDDVYIEQITNVVNIDWFDPRLVYPCDATDLAHLWIVRSSFREATVNHSFDVTRDSCWADIKRALGLDWGAPEDPRYRPQIYEQELHALTDEHGKKHNLEVFVLKRGMTLDEFRKVHSRGDDKGSE